MIVYRELYSSQIGEFELQVESTDELIHSGQDEDAFQTAGHTIRLRCLHPPVDSLSDLMRVETATAWLFYITKHNSSPEKLTFSMDLLPSSGTAIGEADTGEHLVAVGFENNGRQLHLGTEDEDSFAQRADENDWMPRRLKLLLSSNEFEVTTITSSGLRTTVPQLESDEQFYFHYIIAENPTRASLHYPNEPDISTWCAVNQQKHQLETLWQSKIQKP